MARSVLQTPPGPGLGLLEPPREGEGQQGPAALLVSLLPRDNLNPTNAAFVYKGHVPTPRLEG